MALKMNQMKCPSCGANLDFDGERDKVFCTYCGTPIVITDENRKEIVRRTVDEAAVERERRKLREAEMRDKFRNKMEDNEMKLIVGMVIFFILWILGMIIFL